MNVDLNFPVFAFQKNDHMIYVYFEERKLKSTSTEILRTLGYKGISLIDSKGNIFKIKRAYKVKYVGFFGFSLIKKGKQVLIDFEFEGESTNIEISQFKQDIINRIDKNKNFWQSAWDISELKEKINKSTTFREIADLIK